MKRNSPLVVPFALKRLTLATVIGAALFSTATFASQPASIQELFQALKAQPQTQLDGLSVKQAQTEQKAVKAQLMPQLSLFADANFNNHLKNLKPVPPNELGPGKDYPFAYNQYGYGVEAKMPLFVASLYQLKAKAAQLKKAAEAQQQLNLLQSEALLTGYNAELKHLEALIAAIDAQKRSLEESRKVVAIKVQSGRSPETQLINMDEHLNQLNQKRLGLTVQKQKMIDQIQALTGVTLEHSLPMFWQKRPLDTQRFMALDVVEQKKRAAQSGLKAAQEAYYPKVSAYARWSNNYGEAYNTGKTISRDFGTVGIHLSVPLYNASLSTQKEKARQAIEQAELTERKLQQELGSNANTLSTTLTQLDQQAKLAEQSVAHQQQLLKTAKVAYQTGRMTQEEYLRYEDKLLAAKANLYNIQANWWRAQATLAFLYGNHLEDFIQ
jgi:outer membrane protein TolC